MTTLRCVKHICYEGADLFIGCRSQDALRPNVTLDRMSVRAGIAEEQS